MEKRAFLIVVFLVVIMQLYSVIAADDIGFGLPPPPPPAPGGFSDEASTEPINAIPDFSAFRVVSGNQVTIQVSAQSGFTVVERLTSSNAYMVGQNGIYNPQSKEIRWNIADGITNKLAYVFSGAGSVIGEIVVNSQAKQIMGEANLVEPERQRYSSGAEQPASPTPTPAAQQYTAQTPQPITQSAVPAQTAQPSQQPQTPQQQPSYEQPSYQPQQEIGYPGLQEQPITEQPSPLQNPPLTEDLGFNAEYDEEFEKESGLPQTVSPEEKQAMLSGKQVKTGAAIGADSDEEGIGFWGRMMIIFIIALIAGVPAYLFIMHRKAAEIEAQNKVQQQQMQAAYSQAISMLSNYLKTSMKQGYQFQQLYPMLKQRGYTEQQISQAYQMAIKTWY